MLPGVGGNQPPGEDASTHERRPDPDVVVSEFGGWYGSDKAQVERFLMRFGASLNAAEEATQEAFATAWKRITEGTWADIVNQKTWIRIVALNIYRRAPWDRRQPVSTPVADLPELPQPGADHAELTAGIQLVLDALRSLPFDLQVVVVFKMEGFPAPVAAKYLHITDQKARNLFKKARGLLIRYLQEETITEGRQIP